jgi:hypothetical protein
VQRRLAEAMSLEAKAAAAAVLRGPQAPPAASLAGSDSKSASMHALGAGEQQQGLHKTVERFQVPARSSRHGGECRHHDAGMLS